MSVLVSLTDPDAIEQESGNVRWMLSSIPEESIPSGEVDTAVVSRLIRKNRSGSLVALLQHDGRTQRVLLGRGLLSTHERFFHTTSANGLSISDHFRNVVSTVDPALRTTSDASLIEHLLFRQVHGAGTYVSCVQRVARGEVVEIDLVTGKVDRALVDRIEVPTDRAEIDTVVRRLDEAFESATALSMQMGRACLLFSGGIDSTLLLTYLDPAADAVTFVPDTPEFAIETKYARDAARLRGTAIMEIPVAETDYLRLFERSVKLIGIPTTHDVTPLFEPAFDSPHDTVFVGEGADAMFGLSIRLNRVAGWFANAAGVPFLAAIDRVAPAKFKYRTGQLSETARRLAIPPGPRSWAVGGAGGRYADMAIELFGANPVLELLETKMDYVRQRIELEAPQQNHPYANTEIRHWMFVLADPLVMERHQAQARGKRLLAPFGSPEVVHAALQVPADRRYAKGLSGKWLLKEILKKRLPGYPVEQRKRHTALPFDRFVRTGPLADFWNHYDVPEEFTGGHRTAILHGEGLNWQAMTLAMWRVHIAADAALQPHPAQVNVETT